MDNNIKHILHLQEVLLGQQKKVILNGNTIQPPYLHEMEIIFKYFGDYVVS